MRASSSAGVPRAAAAWGLVVLLAVLASVPSTSASAAAEASVPSAASTSAAAKASVPSTSVASTSAAAETSVPSTSVASTSAAAENGCNATALATAIVMSCIEVPDPMTTSCCSFVLPTVDMVDCLCMVVDKPQIADSGTTSRALFGLYLRCGGKRRSGDKPYESCDDFSGSGRSAPSLPAPASPPPPPAPKEMITPTPESEHGSHKIEISTDAGVWVTALLSFIGMALAAYKWFIRGKKDNDGANPPRDLPSLDDKDRGRKLKHDNAIERNPPIFYFYQ